MASGALEPTRMRDHDAKHGSVAMAAHIASAAQQLGRWEAAFVYQFQSPLSLFAAVEFQLDSVVRSSKSRHTSP